MIPVSAYTLHFMEQEEGCRLKAYQDKRKIWTIGVGMTSLYGRPVKPTDIITQQEADRLFGATAQYFQNHVVAMIRPEILAKLKPYQLTALVSLAYNIGLDENHNGIAEGFGDSTLLKKLNAGDFQGAADEFLKWKRAGNDPDELLPRRQRERRLFPLMIVSAATIVVTVITWALNKAIPAWWHQHVANHQTQVDQAGKLCDQHDDCEAQKIQALQGMKRVVTIQTTPAKEAK